MGADTSLNELLFVLGLIGLGVGFYWIHRITKDIEDN
jgi:hypothetical protein